MKKIGLMVLSVGVMSISPVKAGDSAHAEFINNAGETIGHAMVKQGTEGVVINVKVAGLPPGRHGMHFHAMGDCSDHQHFKSATGHIMTHGKPHGYFHPEGPHEGNLPNLIVHDDGTAEVELYSNFVHLSEGEMALLDEDGSTIVIHANPDDHFTQPIGGAGARIACGVFKPQTGEN